MTDLCRKHGAAAIQKHIDEIEDQHLRSMIFVLIPARAGDRERLARLFDFDKSEMRLRARLDYLFPYAGAICRGTGIP